MYILYYLIFFGLPQTFFLTINLIVLDTNYNNKKNTKNKSNKINNLEPLTTEHREFANLIILFYKLPMKDI